MVTINLGSYLSDNHPAGNVAITAPMKNAENMKPTTSTRDRTFRFLSDRYAYRERPNYLAELAVFGIVAIITIWPMFSPADALVILR